MSGKLHRFSAPTYNEALLKATIALGGNIRVVQKKEIRCGGFFGFFQRRELELIVTSENRRSNVPEEQSPNPGEPEAPTVKAKFLSPSSLKTRKIVDHQVTPPDSENIRKILSLIDKNRAGKKIAQVQADGKVNEPSPERSSPVTLSGENVCQSDLAALETDVSEIRRNLDLMQNSLSPGKAFADQDPETDALPQSVKDLKSSLLSHRVDRKRVIKICRAISDSLARRGDFTWNLRDLLKEELQSILPIRHFDLHHQQCQIFSLIGPTGSGKTSTIAKLAAKWKLNHENLKVGMITLDTFRLGAVEQIMAISELIQIPLEIAYNKSDLDEKIRKFRQEDYNLIFIDNAGRCPNNSKETAEMFEILSDPEISNYLVFCANYKEKDMDNIFRRFSPARLKGTIITKTDETRKYGFLINLSEHFRGSPLYCLTDGQDIPHKIVFPSYNDIAGLFFADKR
ncbi:MAG: AAA family ATPase [Candidatus Wallbacteria bacterium]|nr:AAA family ATPase [Candidatus Wallbacteria bacterium]